MSESRSKKRNSKTPSGGDGAQQGSGGAGGAGGRGEPGGAATTPPGGTISAERRRQLDREMRREIDRAIVREMVIEMENERRRELLDDDDTFSRFSETASRRRLRGEYRTGDGLSIAMLLSEMCTLTPAELSAILAEIPAERLLPDDANYRHERRVLRILRDLSQASIADE